MSDNKKYYYMRLKEDFFNSPELRTIEKMRGGYKYSNILLKLYLLSLRDEGRLMLRKTIPYDIPMLANLTGFSKTEVENALKIFREFELVEMLDGGTIYMLDIQNYIGISSTEADRQREYQRRITNEKCKESNKKSCDVSTPEIELKTKLKTERESAPALSFPTSTEAAEHFKEMGYCSDPQKFVAYYDSLGWKTSGGTYIEDWKARAKLWESRELKRRPQEQKVRDDRTTEIPSDEDIAKKTGKTVEEYQKWRNQ